MNKIYDDMQINVSICLICKTTQIKTEIFLHCIYNAIINPYPAVKISYAKKVFDVSNQSFLISIFCIQK